MDQLTTVRERIETMMADGSISEGDYLEIMNNLKGVYDAIPRAQPVASAIDIRTFFGGSNARSTPILAPTPRSLFDLYLNVSNGDSDIETSFITDLHCFILRPDAELPRRMLSDTLDDNGHIPYVLQRNSHLWRGVPLWRDPAHQELVCALPAWRKAVLNMMIAQRIEVMGLLNELWDGTRDRQTAKPSDALVQDLAIRLKLPGICFSKMIRYRKVVDVDTTKLHRISLQIPTPTTRDRIIECWTNRIQFGRTPCVDTFSQFNFIMGLWTYLYYQGGGVPIVEQEFERMLIGYCKNRYNRDPLYLETSGITARTKNKHRKYISPALSGFSLTYAESINSPH